MRRILPGVLAHVDGATSDGHRLVRGGVSPARRSCIAPSHSFLLRQREIGGRVRYVEERFSPA
jgi:hypothetical protein